jgi:hypothetical protein
VKAEEEALSNAAVAEELSRSLSSTSLHRAATGNEEKNATAAKAVKSANADNDLDAYLMGALGSDEEEAGTVVQLFFTLLSRGSGVMTQGWVHLQ